MISAEASIGFNAAEKREGPRQKIERIIKKIRDLGRKIKEKLGFSGEKLTEATDEALVFNAKETITSADEDGVRTEEESAAIKEAVTDVVVEGAMEEAGIVKSDAENPVILLSKDENFVPDLVVTLNELKEEEATLPTGENVAELAGAVLEKAEATNETPAETTADDSVILLPKDENFVPDRVISLNPTETTDAAKNVDAAETAEKAPRKSLSEVIDEVRNREMEGYVRPRSELICDKNHIENQRIDVINKQDKGMIELSLKLRNPVDKIFTTDKTLSGTPVKYGKFSYESSKDGSHYALCPSFEFVKDGLKVSIASPDDEIRAALGLIKIEAPKEMDSNDIEKALSGIFEEDFGIDDALGEVSDEAERDYKQSRCAWHHKIYDNASEVDKKSEKYRRKEVFPGYSTFVEEGKHNEYLEKYGDIRAIHHLHTGDAASIYSVLTSGLMCSSERYERGILRNGMSTNEDFKTGGADSVFTRVIKRENIAGKSGAVVILKPEIFDRTDWYAYDSDNYGSTEEHAYSKRISPDELFNELANDSLCLNNEQMFRTGIGADYLENIQVSVNVRDKIVAELKEMGLEQVGGRPIEEIVIANPRELEKLREKQENEEMIKKFNEEKKQAILNGELVFYTFNQLEIYCNNDKEEFCAFCDAMVAQGKKEDLKKNLEDSIRNNSFTLNILFEAATNNNEHTVAPYLQNVIGIDFRRLRADKVFEEIFEDFGGKPKTEESYDLNEPNPFKQMTFDDYEEDLSDFK